MASTTEREKEIWDLLMDKIGNPYGVAGIMGNLMAESSLNPLRMTGKKAKEWIPSDYAESVSNGKLSEYDFAHDGIAFGLAQWLYWSRKQAFYKFIRGMGLHAGSIQGQVGYLLEELPKYKTVWNMVISAKTVKEASDIVLEKYEKPASVTDAVKAKREKYSQQYYDKYAKTIEEKTPETGDLFVQTTAANVIMRCGNGKEFSAIGKIKNEGSVYPWVANSVNGWYAIKMANQVVWISNEFGKIVSGSNYSYA